VLARAAIVAAACGALVPAAAAPPGGERPTKIVAFGDSLTAGRGLAADATFPARLEQALTARGFAVEVVNAGVSGDTSADGLERLEWSVPDDTDAVILELGANDALRGIDPLLVRASLETIVRRLDIRHVPILLAGMRAPPNMGSEYTRAFDAIYPELAVRFGLLYYPFFLDGVALDASLNQEDGLHPNEAGIKVIVQRLLPKAEELIARVRQQHGH
jgi:acyl-CoA thioesterase I